MKREIVLNLLNTVSSWEANGLCKAYNSEVKFWQRYTFNGFCKAMLELIKEGLVDSKYDSGQMSSYYVITDKGKSFLSILNG